MLASLLRQRGLPQLSVARCATASRRTFCTAPITVRPLHLLLYHYVEDVEEARQPFRQAHVAAARASAQRGELLLGGALADPVDGGVLVFTTGEAAENFAEADPYVLNDIVTQWTVREWSVVVGALELPPVPPFAATYKWQRVESGTILPPGLEVEMPLDGSPQRARIPPEWALRLNVKDSAGFAFTFDVHVDVTRATTMREIREAAARHVTQTGSMGEVSAEKISLTVEGHTGELDDARTAEEVDLFSNATKVKAAMRAAE